MTPDASSDSLVYGLGRLEAYDGRDREHPFAAHLPPTASARRWRYWTPGPILNQGATSQCVAYSFKQLLQSSPYRQAINLRESFVYNWCQLHDEWPDPNGVPDYDGTSVRAGAKFLQGIGWLSEYVWATTVGELRDWLLERGPVVVGTRWHRDMYTPDDRGFVTPTGPVEGGHAYVLLGYSANRGAYRGINSWGEGWGENGRFWIAEEDMGTLLAMGGEACAPTELLL